MAEGKSRETLISFKSGHFKKVTGQWKGDSVWTHFSKDAGGMVHVNKTEVEYMETFGPVPAVDPIPFKNPGPGQDVGSEKWEEFDGPLGSR